MTASPDHSREPATAVHLDFDHVTIGGHVFVGNQIFIGAHEKPPLFYGVPSIPNHFVGRRPLATKLVRRLTGGRSVSVSTGGAGGVGKTTLAVALAHDRRVLEHFSDGVLWAGLGKRSDVARLQAEWATALGLEISGIPDPAHRARAIQNAIGMRAVLLIIDDAWDQAAANLLRCGGPNCCHLLTTRDDGLAREFAGAAFTQKVPELEERYAFELLRALAPEACGADPEGARSLAKAVGGLPLAIELLGGYLGAPERSELPDARSDALRELSTPAARLRLARERFGAPPGSSITLEQTIELSLDDLSQETVRGFYALGAFAPKPETFDVVTAAVVARVGASHLGSLLRRNLLEPAGRDRLRIHQVLADFARSRMPQAVVVRHRRAYLALVNTDRRAWRVIEREYGQIKQAWSGIRLEAHRHRIEFANALAPYQELRGLRWDHLAWTEAALHDARATGSRSDVADLLVNAGYVHGMLGQSDRALQCFEQALPLMREEGSSEGVVATLQNLAIVHVRLGQFQRGVEYYEQALVICEETENRRSASISLNGIGIVKQRMGAPEQGLTYFTRALRNDEEIGDQQWQARTLNNMGSAYLDLGDQQSALRHYERALPMREEAGDRWGTAVTLESIGKVYVVQGLHEKAVVYLERARAIFEQIGDRPRVADMLTEIATVYASLGQQEKALESLDQAHAIQQ